MSWNASYDSKAAFDANAPTFESQSKEPQMQDQVEVARSLAKLAIESGAVGNAETKDFAVYLSGHANPEHEPATGWANDCITVTVSQKAAAK